MGYTAPARLARLTGTAGLSSLAASNMSSPIDLTGDDDVGQARSPSPYQGKYCRLKMKHLSSLVATQTRSGVKPYILTKAHEKQP